MKRAVSSKRSVAAMLITVAALAGGVIVGASHPATVSGSVTPMTWCPPHC